MIIRIGLMVALGYILLMILAFIWQRKLIYFPDESMPTADQLLALELIPWPKRGEAYRGFIAASPPTPSKGTVVVFHGNAGAAWHRHYYVQALVPLGYRVVLAEYPGYGGRKGTPSEASFISEARQTLQLAHKQFGGPLYLMGESLGCGVAAAMTAALPDTINGVVLITPWDSLPGLAQSIYWYFPVKWLLKDRFDNVANLEGFHQPVAVVIAAKDEIIPRKRSLNLYDRLTSPKRLWRFEHAGHNNWPTGSTEPWWREVMDFVSAGDDQTVVPKQQ